MYSSQSCLLRSSVRWGGGIGWVALCLIHLRQASPEELMEGRGVNGKERKLTWSYSVRHTSINTGILIGNGLLVKANKTLLNLLKNTLRSHWGAEGRMLTCTFRAVVQTFKHSTSSCVPPLAPGSTHSQMLFFCHHCKPATKTHYIYIRYIYIRYRIHLLNIRVSVSLSQPGSWEVTKSSYRTRAQIII